MARDPEVSQLVRNIMTETEAVAAKLGIELPVSIDQRIAGAEKVGEHKTSMLQDLEAGRPMELEAIVGAVVELGERLGVPMPDTRAVYACAKLLEQTAMRKREPLTPERLTPQPREDVVPEPGEITRDESLATARGGRGRDDHDREPAIFLDAFRQTYYRGDRLEAIGSPVGIHVFHCG